MNPVFESKEESPEVDSGSKSRDLLEPMHVSMQEYNHMEVYGPFPRIQIRQNIPHVGGSITSGLSKLRTFREAYIHLKQKRSPSISGS